ncbi:MAG: SUMF1/EgtB/PvdO family nonheme iron enzyme [Treponema sp.]|jgi:formylglycine-generating enzyme required for sulfatase activity|nr:SUMF1/EgtB/PvdO family nonheme iron enzyme [Treponema sp.]
MKKQRLFILASVILSLVGCKNFFLNDILRDTSPENRNPGEVIYQVRVKESIINGKVVTKPESGPAGGEVILQISPEPGYRLKNGSLKYQGPQGDVLIDEITRSFTLPAGNVAVSAEFEALPADNYSISVLIGPEEHGIVLARPEYGVQGTPVNLIVIPDPGYRYKPGTLNYNSVAIDDLERTFILPGGNVTITAQFEELPGVVYTVRSGNPAHGRIFPKPAEGAPGTEIYLEAIPEPGYALKGGSLKYRDPSGEGPVHEVSQTFRLPAEHVTVTGEFEALAPGNYTVGVVNRTGGRIIPVPSFGKAGDAIYLWVIPDPGFILMEDTLVYTNAAGNYGVDKNTRSFAMPADHVTVRAEFAPVETGEYTVRTENSAHGRILASPEHEKTGAVISLLVNPDPGYKLKEGSLRYINTSGGSAPIDERVFNFFLPTDHVTVQAEFEALPLGNYTIQTGQVPHGHITPQPAFGPPQMPIYLWVTPDPGYILALHGLHYQTLPDLRTVTVNDTSQTFELPAAHIRVSGDFEKVPAGYYTLRIEPTAHGRIRINPEYQQSGDTVTVNVVPDPGYRLKSGSLRYEGLMGAAKVIDKTNQFTMPGEHLTLYGEFEPQIHRVALDPAMNMGGSITTNITSGVVGTPVILRIHPKNGYRFVPGSLKYTTAGGTDVPINEHSLWFALPEADITISARFEFFTALKDLKINGRPFTLTEGKTSYTVRIPAQEDQVQFNFTIDRSTTVNPKSGNSYTLQLFENPPIRYTVETPDGISKMTYTFTVIKELIGAERVPAGSFQRDKTPNNITVISEAFKMGRHEVTQAEWKEVMGYSRGEPAGRTYPENKISWYETLIFCNKLSILEKKTPAYEVNGERDPQKWPTQKNSWTIQLCLDADGYRLPTEAEWLWAAMGADYHNKSQINTTGYTYTHAGIKLGFSMSNAAWYGTNSNSHSWPVAQKSPNELGLYDMSGNVGEWCWDWHNNKEAYDIQGNVTDYTGPAQGRNRMVRGGNYAGPEQTIFLSCRGGLYIASVLPYALPETEANWIGFRVICKE